MEFKLLVIRTSDIERLSEFYSLLGMTFRYHMHGNSPYHYSTTVGKTVLEIYPLAKTQSIIDNNLRLGFSLDNFEDSIQGLRQNEVVFVKEPMQTEFGFMAIIQDPDGRKIELYKS